MEPNSAPTEFERRVDEAIIKLQACQAEKNLKSCSKCELYLECELRTMYVRTVYESMSKGEIGGFEF